MTITPYDQYDAAVIISTAPRVADNLTLLAGRYPEFRKWLEGGGDGMMWLKVAFGMASLIVPIAAHHNILPLDEKEMYKKFVDPSVTIK